MKSTCAAAVFVDSSKPLELRQFPLPDKLDKGAMLCKVLMSTICGSDLHTIAGRRREPAPLILGHEIVGRIVALGDADATDARGEKLEIGDRVTWTIMASCGRCRYCRLNLPQKCEHLKKYGHTCCEEAPHLTGGYAEYICLLDGTAVFKIPCTIPDDVAAPANCALSTVINATEAIGLQAGETVLIHGAGLLGLNLAALAREAGAAEVIMVDVSAPRLALATDFGATQCINTSVTPWSKAVEQIADTTPCRGVDVAFEVCGWAGAVAQGVEALRIGGRYLIAGLVMPGSDLAIDGNTLTRKCLTIKGIHNYRPDHLGAAVDFLQQNCRRYPYVDIVGATFPLSDINSAVAAAATGTHLRVGVTT